MSPTVKKQSLPVGKKPTTAKQSASPRKTVAVGKSGKDAGKEFAGLKKVKIDEAARQSIAGTKPVALSKKNSVQPGPSMKSMGKLGSMM